MPGMFSLVMIDSRLGSITSLFETSHKMILLLLRKIGDKDWANRFLIEDICAWYEVRQNLSTF